MCGAGPSLEDHLDLRQLGSASERVRDTKHKDNTAAIDPSSDSESYQSNKAYLELIYIYIHTTNTYIQYIYMYIYV